MATYNHFVNIIFNSNEKALGKRTHIYPAPSMHQALLTDTLNHLILTAAIKSPFCKTRY